LKAAKGHVRCGLCDEVFNASIDQDVKLPEIIPDIAQTPDNEKHDDESQQQEAVEQLEPEEKIDSSLDYPADASDDAQPSDSNQMVDIDVTNQQDESLHDNDSSDEDTFDTDDMDENESLTEDNLTKENDELSDDYDDEAPQETQGQEEQPEVETSDEKNFDVDTIDLNELDIDNSAQDDNTDGDEIYLSEDDENFSANDTLDDDIDIEVSNDDEQPKDDQQENEPQDEALDFFDEDNNQDSPQIIPDELREQAATNDASIGKNIAWVGGILLLSLTLGLQYFWLNRNQFVQSSDTQALIEKACLTFNCSKLTLRDPSNIELLTRNVYSHPNEKNALMINIVLQNNAKFSQPYPMLQINFSDIRGDDVVARRFAPAEYLKIDQKNHPLLQPGTSANFNLEIEDPGKQAITYEFSFL
jgi:hypothetical protein